MWPTGFWFETYVSSMGIVKANHGGSNTQCVWNQYEGTRGWVTSPKKAFWCVSALYTWLLDRFRSHLPIPITFLDWVYNPLIANLSHCTICYMSTLMIWYMFNIRSTTHTYIQLYTYNMIYDMWAELMIHMIHM